MALGGLILDIIKLTKTHGNENGLFNVIMFWGKHRCVSLFGFHLTKSVALKAQTLHAQARFFEYGKGGGGHLF